MDAFSPLGARFTTTDPARGHPQDSPAEDAKLDHHQQQQHHALSYPRSSATRPSGLSHVSTLEDDIASSAASNKRTFPLLERLQSAIRSIEERTPVRPSEERSSREEPLEQHQVPLVQPSKPAPPHEPFDHSRIERLIESSHRRLYDQLQTDLHSLHMELLKQCLAMQVHQERVLKMYLPQVKELAEELRSLRDENARLRARLQYQ